MRKGSMGDVSDMTHSVEDLGSVMGQDNILNIVITDSNSSMTLDTGRGNKSARGKKKKKGKGKSKKSSQMGMTAKEVLEL